MLWRLVIVSLLVLGFSAPPVTAQSPILEQTSSEATYQVTAHGGQYPYVPSMTPADAVLARPTGPLLALDVSLTNTSPAPMRFSAANFRVRAWNGRVLSPGYVANLNAQPALAVDGDLPPYYGSDVRPTARGWLIFDLVAPYESVDGFELEYQPPSDPRWAIQRSLLSIRLRQ